MIIGVVYPLLVWVMALDRLLLIVSCSRRKRSDLGLLPAIERYDGVSFRLLRKARREGYWPENLDVLILSAKYGLIDISTPIAHYEQRMTRNRANDLKSQVFQVLQTLTQEFSYSAVYVELGKDYQDVMEGLTQLFSASSVVYAKGRIGQRLAHLRQWLLAQCYGRKLWSVKGPSSQQFLAAIAGH